MLAVQLGSSSLSRIGTQKIKGQRARLAISPDLDALLEHEERVRGNGVEVALQFPLSSPSSANSASYHVAANAFPVGLPPPPRGERGKRKRGTSMGEGPEKTRTLIGPEQQPSSVDIHAARGDSNYSHGFGSMCSPSTNPYINPAPKLEHLSLTQDKTDTKMVAHRRATINNSGNSRCFAAEHEISRTHLNEGEDLVGNAKTRDCDGTAFASVQPSVSRPTDGKQRRSNKKARRLKKQSCAATETVPTMSQERSPTSLVQWRDAVDQQLNSCENLFQERVPGMSRQAKRDKRGLSYSNPISHLASAGQLKRHSRSKRVKTTGQRRAAVIDQIMSGQNTRDDIPVLDIRRRHSVDFLDITNEGGEHSTVWRRQRPSNSHVVPSRRSGISIDSGSDVERSPTPPPARKRGGQAGLNLPSTDTEERQAPKAVYYPAADKTEADRESFIDFFSPTSPAFNNPSSETIHLMPATSKVQWQEKYSQRLPSRPKSAGPKPIFSIPAFKSSSKPPSRSASPLLGGAGGGRGGGNDALPPLTTNFLDTDERAELVRKSRKLTRLFGETPVGEMIITPIEPVAIGRRHSVPTTPTELLSQTIRTSFMDLSDEDEDDHRDQIYPDHDRLSPIIFAPNPAGTPRARSPSAVSLAESISPEQRAEDERRRKREKLAKLHRYLGSRVPADLVLGVDPLHTSSLPPIDPLSPLSMPSDNDSDRKLWLRRRRSSSAGDVPSWSDDVDRMKEELNEKEKAINVRRAQKMEKMFGVAPPQTLYHTRHSPSPSVPNAIYMKRAKFSPGPSFGDFVPPGTVPSPTYQQRNPNRTSYMKPKHKQNTRPSTSESSMRLLPEGQNCYDFDETRAQRTSLIFSHYQHSLKSLSDILDRDDRESLAELHQYLNDYEDTNLTLSPLRDTPLPKDRRLSNASSIKSERRRSLPARTSISSTMSGASDLSILITKPEVTDFQLRRRRAAKLTQFFGVNYRELINDVLDSLEHGLEHERNRGTLRAEEVEDLLERLRRIKTKRKGLF